MPQRTIITGRLAVCAVTMCVALSPTSAQVINNLPVAVTSTHDVTQILGSVPAVTAGGNQPPFQEIGKSTPTPSLDATIWAKLPQGNAIKSVEYFVKPTGSSAWRSCEQGTYADPRFGSPVKRTLCGNEKNAELSIGNGNFTCNNIAADDRFLLMAFKLQHVSTASGFDFRILVHHLNCASDPSSFRKN